MAPSRNATAANVLITETTVATFWWDTNSVLPSGVLVCRSEQMSWGNRTDAYPEEKSKTAFEQSSEPVSNYWWSKHAKVLGLVQMSLHSALRSGICKRRYLPRRRDGFSLELT